MKFDNSSVRRRDRLLESELAIDLLVKGEYGFLAMAGSDEDPGGYGAPMSYAFDGDDIWFHCALDGRKQRKIDGCNMVSFCVVGNTSVRADKFDTLYESVMVFGRIEVIADIRSAREGLALLVKKYSPDYIEPGASYIEKMFQRTVVLRLKIETISAKAKKAVVSPF